MQAKKRIGARVVVFVWVGLISLGVWTGAVAQEVDRKTPARLYGRLCLACHGPTGAGTVIGTPIVTVNCRLMDIDRNGEIWCAGSGVSQLVRLKVK